MFLTTLAAVARRTGRPVVEVPGWETLTRRDSPNGFSAKPKSFVPHHTGTPRTVLGNFPALNTVRNGRPDLSGPLSNYGLGRDGTIYVIAAGVCNHVGPAISADYSNSAAVGCEAENAGDGSEPWPEEQLVSYRLLAREVADEYDFSLDHVKGHKEVAVDDAGHLGRKTDPNFDMDAFRASLNTAEEKPVSYGRVWGDIERLYPTLLARLQKAANLARVNIYVQDGWRSMADAWKFWNAYQRFLRGGPRAPVAAYPGTSLHMGNAPQYALALAADITCYNEAGKAVNQRTTLRPVAAAAKIHDPVKSEDWHWQCIEDRNPPMEHPLPTAGTVLKVGSEGDAVRVLQERINYLMRGKPGFPIATDGRYGNGTANAVKAYQTQAYGLGPAEADGIAGEKTQNSVNFWFVVVENRYSGKPTVKVGSTGEDVKLVQSICSLMGVPTAVDGNFGMGTEGSVRTVQGKWGIAKDGVAGKDFWAKADDLMDFIGKAN